MLFSYLQRFRITNEFKLKASQNKGGKKPPKMTVIIDTTDLISSYIIMNRCQFVCVSTIQLLQTSEVY